MPSKTLLTYIQTELAKGTIESSIRAQCLSAGWPPLMVDEAFVFLTSVENGPGTPKALSLKKKSKLIPLIKLGFGLIFLNYMIKLINLAGMTVISQIKMIGASEGSLPFQYLTYNGWYYPSIMALLFLASYLSLKQFFNLPQRTQIVWKKALITLILLLVIEVIIFYLSIQFLMPINNLIDSY